MDHRLLGPGRARHALRSKRRVNRLQQVSCHHSCRSRFDTGAIHQYTVESKEKPALEWRHKQPASAIRLQQVQSIVRQHMTLDDAIRELRSRNEPVPLPMRLPTLTEIDDAERRLGVKFPADFRRYLLEASDIVFGTIEPVTITRPDSHTDLFRVAEDAWQAYGVPRNLLPICEDNADFYCVNEANEVVYWSHNGWSSEKWSTLAHWVQDVWLRLPNSSMASEVK